MPTVGKEPKAPPRNKVEQKQAKESSADDEIYEKQPLMIPYPQTIYLCDQFIIPYIKPLCFVKTMVLYRSPSCKKRLSKLSYQVASYWRADREAEGARLLSEYAPKGHLGFESPALRQYEFEEGFHLGPFFVRRKEAGDSNPQKRRHPFGRLLSVG